MNKFNKGKTIGILAASLSAVSLMGVGFASWIISGAENGTTSDITIGVAGVEDNRIKIENATVTEGNLRFDAARTGVTAGDILSASTDAAQDLDFTITYNIVSNNSEKHFMVFAYVESYANSDLQTAVDKKYIELPTALGTAAKNDVSSNTSNYSVYFDGTDTIKKATGATVTKNSDSYFVTQTFSFTWGEAFGGNNPVTINQGQEIWNPLAAPAAKASATIEIVKASLNDFKSLNSKTFKVVLQPVIID